MIAPSSTDYITTSDDGSIIRKELNEGTEEVIFSSELYNTSDYQGFSLSKTSEYVVFWKNKNEVSKFIYFKQNFYFLVLMYNL